MDQAFLFDDVCRYVGRLFLTNQREFERQDAINAAQRKQLEEELAALKKRTVELERKVAESK